VIYYHNTVYTATAAVTTTFRRHRAWLMDGRAPVPPGRPRNNNNNNDVVKTCARVVRKFVLGAVGRGRQGKYLYNNARAESRVVETIRAYESSARELWTTYYSIVYTVRAAESADNRLRPAGGRHLAPDNARKSHTHREPHINVYVCIIRARSAETHYLVYVYVYQDRYFFFFFFFSFPKVESNKWRSAKL